MPAYWWLIAAAVVVALAATARWMAQWTSKHPPIIPAERNDDALPHQEATRTQ